MNHTLRIEFHCHTRYSKDSLVEVEHLLATCRRKGIDRVVITDHNTIEGAIRAKEVDPERVIVGEEIMTQSGEILAAFVKEEIPPGLPAETVIKLLRAQDAFISVSHPFDVLRSGHWTENDLLAILPSIDAIETFNARCMHPRFNETARQFARKHRLFNETVGSDAHTSVELGTATLSLPYFNDTNSLKTALLMAEQHCSISPPWVHLYSRYAVWWKKLRGIIELT